MTDKLPNVVEVHSAGNGQIVFTLSRDGQRALPMLCFTDDFDSNWLVGLAAGELVRVFAQIENILTAEESDIAGWVSQLRGEHQPDNTLQEGTVMRFISNELPTSEGLDEPLVSLAELAIELTSGDVDRLADQIGKDAIVLDDIGRRAVTKSTARKLFTEHAQREANRARRQAQRHKEHAELVARLRSERRGGLPVVSGNALADMVGFDQR